MIIKTVTRSFSKTIQERDYEPVNIFASYTAELEKGDNAQEVSENLYKGVVDAVGVSVAEKMWEKYTNPQKTVRRMVKANLEDKAF